MKSYIGDTVRRLLELHSLEDRLSVLRRDKGGRTYAQALIESLRAKLPAGVMSSHDRFRAAGKRSVAEVRHGICSACHMGVATGLLAHLRRSDGLHRCENCGCYLYLVEEEEADRQPVRRRASRTAAAVNPA